jgi:outer membrane protein insertion porin family
MPFPRRPLLTVLLLGLVCLGAGAQESLSPAGAASAPDQPPVSRQKEEVSTGAASGPARKAGEQGAEESKGEREEGQGPEVMEPAEGALRLTGEEGFGLGTAVGDPSALNGPDRTEPVLNGATRSSTVNITGHYLAKPADNQQILLELNLDPTFLGTDISYSWQPEGWEGVFTGNFFLSTAHFSPFEQAEPDVILPNLQEPFLQQGGLGLEYAQEMSESFDLALALNYQRFGFSDDLLGGTRFARDFTGTPLALGDRASGDLYTFNLQGVYDTLDDRDLPTEGSKIRFGLEQGLGLGNTSTPYTRLTANVAHLFAAPGLNDGPHSLLVNLQAGTLVGDDAPQIRGFFLGGPFSVRGYEQGEMAGGTSFLQGTVEYRHHLTTFAVKEHEVELRAAAFVDYGTVLGTEKRLRGVPEYLWDKPDHGTGYGFGLHLATEFGLFRLETAWSDRGDQSTYLSVGERF